MFNVDLNCDLGESFGNYILGMDKEVIPLITSANIACGFHASDPITMQKTVEMAAKNGIAIGAHPGFPDLMGFGRRNMNCSAQEVKAYIIYQVGALSAFAKSCNVPMEHVKPHGALYNMAAKDKKLALAICEGIASVDEHLILLALNGSCMIESAKEVGIPYAREVFADRAYEKDGTLVSRLKEGAMIVDEEEAAARVIEMITKGKVKSIDGEIIDIQADSVCVHGDNVHSLDFVKKILKEFEKNNIKTCSLRKIIKN